MSSPFKVSWKISFGFPNVYYILWIYVVVSVWRRAHGNYFGRDAFKWNLEGYWTRLLSIIFKAVFFCDFYRQLPTVAFWFGHNYKDVDWFWNSGTNSILFRLEFGESDISELKVPVKHASFRTHVVSTLFLSYFLTPTEDANVNFFFYKRFKTTKRTSGTIP